MFEGSREDYLDHLLREKEEQLGPLQASMNSLRLLRLTAEQQRIWEVKA